MEDYEKLEQMINNPSLMESSRDPEIEKLSQVIQALKNAQSNVSFRAEAKSRQLMLAEAEQVRKSNRERRISFIGSLYGWAVPAILLLAVAGSVFGNSTQRVQDESQVQVIESGSAPSLLLTISPDTEALNLKPIGSESGGDDILSEIVTTTVTITPTIVFPLTPVANDSIAYPGPEAASQEDGLLDVSVPERPLLGSEIKPLETPKP